MEEQSVFHCVIIQTNNPRDNNFDDDVHYLNHLTVPSSPSHPLLSCGCLCQPLRSKLSPLINCSQRRLQQGGLVMREMLDVGDCVTATSYNRGWLSSLLSLYEATGCGPARESSACISCQFSTQQDCFDDYHPLDRIKCSSVPAIRRKQMTASDVSLAYDLRE